MWAGLLQACPLLRGRGTHLPCLRGRGDRPAPLRRPMGHGARAAPLRRLMGRGSSATPLHQLTRRGIGAAPSTVTSGMASDPSPPTHRSSAGTPTVTADPPAPIEPRGRPGSTVPMDSLPSAWNGKGPYVGNESSSTRSPQSMPATSSSDSSSSSSSSLLVSSPRSQAYCFRIAFFFTSSRVFLSQPAAVRFAAAQVGSFGNGAGLSLKYSPPGWSRHPKVNIRGSEIIREERSKRQENL